MNKVNLLDAHQESKLGRNILFGFLVAMIGFILLSFQSASAAPSPAHETERDSSPWEQLCLRGTMAACDKASSILADRLIETDDVLKEKLVRDRLVRVSLVGCQAGHVASCSELVTADETAAHRALALKTATQQCVVKGKVKSESCQLKARLTALPDTGKDLLDEPLAL